MCFISLAVRSMTFFVVLAQTAYSLINVNNLTNSHIFFTAYASKRWVPEIKFLLICSILTWVLSIFVSFVSTKASLEVILSQILHIIKNPPWVHLMCTIEYVFDVFHGSQSLTLNHLFLSFFLQDISPSGCLSLQTTVQCPLQTCCSNGNHS